MYLSDTTKNVEKLLEELELLDDVSRMKFLLYIFNSLNNNQINNKNEVNPNLTGDDDLIIFNFPSIGFEDNYVTIFLQYNVMVYNTLCKNNKIKAELVAYEENGNVIGVEYDTENRELIKSFENLSFEEKLDIFGEIVIRYDNETYFENKITMLTFDMDKTGFDIAKLIKDFKNSNK